MSAGVITAIGLALAAAGLMTAAVPRSPLTRWLGPVCCLLGAILTLVGGIASGGGPWFVIFIGAPLLAAAILFCVLNMRAKALPAEATAHQGNSRPLR